MVFPYVNAGVPSPYELLYQGKRDAFFTVAFLQVALKNRNGYKFLLLIGEHFQLEKLAQQVERHQFRTRFFTELEGSSCATLKHISVLQPFSQTHSSLINFHLK